MSESSFVDKYVKRDRPDDSDPVESVSSFFGILRGHKERAVALELRRKDGVVLVLPYSRLDQCLFDPSDGLTLKFGEQRVRLTGRYLDKPLRPNLALITCFSTHRLAWLREASKAEMLALGKSQPMVEAIEW